jgi:hypothetical protein
MPRPTVVINAFVIHDGFHPAACPWPDKIFKHYGAADDVESGRVNGVSLLDLGYTNFRYPVRALSHAVAVHLPVVGMLQRSIAARSETGRPSGSVCLSNPLRRRWLSF